MGAPLEQHGFDSPIFADQGFQHSAGEGMGPSVHGAGQPGDHNAELFAQAQRMHISSAEQSQHRDPLSGEIHQPASVLAPVAEPQPERYMGGTGQGSLGAYQDANHKMHSGNTEILAANKTHTSVKEQQDIAMAPDTHVAPGEPIHMGAPTEAFKKGAEKYAASYGSGASGGASKEEDR